MRGAVEGRPRPALERAATCVTTCFGVGRADAFSFAQRSSNSCDQFVTELCGVGKHRDVCPRTELRVVKNGLDNRGVVRKTRAKAHGEWGQRGSNGEHCVRSAHAVSDVILGKTPDTAEVARVVSPQVSSRGRRGKVCAKHIREILELLRGPRRPHATTT